MRVYCLHLIKFLHDYEIHLQATHLSECPQWHVSLYCGQYSSEHFGSLIYRPVTAFYNIVHGCYCQLVGYSGDTVKKGGKSKRFSPDYFTYPIITMWLLSHATLQEED